MKNPFFRFIIKATLFLGVVFCVHLIVLKIFNYPLFENRIVLSYIINLLLVIVIFGALYVFKTKYKNQLGFIFLFGSLLKFAAFFIVFYPFYNMDNHLSKIEFATFFVPYAFGLILDTISLSKWLNSLE